MPNTCPFVPSAIPKSVKLDGITGLFFMKESDESSNSVQSD